MKRKKKVTCVHFELFQVIWTLTTSFFVRSVVAVPIFVATLPGFDANAVVASEVISRAHIVSYPTEKKKKRLKLKS
jgi:hypothetical protein